MNIIPCHNVAVVLVRDPREDELWAAAQVAVRVTGAQLQLIRDVFCPFFD